MIEDDGDDLTQLFRLAWQELLAQTEENSYRGKYADAAAVEFPNDPAAYGMVPLRRRPPARRAQRYVGSPSQPGDPFADAITPRDLWRSPSLEVVKIFCRAGDRTWP